MLSSCTSPNRNFQHGISSMGVIVPWHTLHHKIQLIVCSLLCLASGMVRLEYCDLSFVDVNNSCLLRSLGSHLSHASSSSIILQVTLFNGYIHVINIDTFMALCYTTKLIYNHEDLWGSKYNYV